MNLIVQPSQLCGKIQIPSSKSHTIRAICIAALATGTSTIHNPLVSDDTNSAANAFSSLGAKILKGKTWNVTGMSARPEAPDETIDVGNSGTTLRLATGAAALGKDIIVLDGDASTRTRPMQPLLDSLTHLGAKTRSLKDNGKCPVSVQGRITGGATTVSGITSQFTSSLLIAAPLAEKDSTITVQKLNEKPYVEMTLQWLSEQDIRYRHHNLEHFTIKGNQSYSQFEKTIPGDFSSATFPLCAAAITEGDILLKGLDMKDAQGDKEVIEILKRMGAKICEEKEGIRVIGGHLKGATIDLNNYPDALPALAIAGCAAEGTTVLQNVPQARLKETDRISAMAMELKKMGADITEKPDGLIIKKSLLKGAKVKGHHDHRIVMALTLAGMAAEGSTEIDTAEAYRVTYPTFVDDMKKIGAKIRTTG